MPGMGRVSSDFDRSENFRKPFRTSINPSQSCFRVHTRPYSPYPPETTIWNSIGHVYMLQHCWLKTIKSFYLDSSGLGRSRKVRTCVCETAAAHSGLLGSMSAVNCLEP